jgi:hypothetical protein
MKILIALALFCTALFAQPKLTPAAAGSTTLQLGGAGNVTIALLQDGRGITMVQWQYSWSQAGVTLQQGSLQSAGTAGHKSVQCFAAGCGLYGEDLTSTPPGLNSTVIVDGLIAAQPFTVPANAAPGSLILTLTNILATDAAGNAIAIAAGPAVTFTIQPQKADLNSDGSIDWRDVAIAIAQSLGISNCFSADQNGDGKCNVQDVQLVIKAAGF